MKPRFTILLFVASFFLLQCGVKKEGRVRLGNEMEEYALSYLEKKELLQDDESIIAYYDYTLSLNAKEAAILTDKRIIYHNKTEVSDIAIDNITDTNYSEEGITGRAIIEVYSNKGESLKIEIAPFHGGKTFYRALTNQLD